MLVWTVFAVLAGFAALAFGGVAAPAAAQEASVHSNQPVPRFATINSSRVNMRQGPGQDHRILWVFESQQGLPVEIVAETETWRQIRDPDGDLGWVHRSLLSDARSVMITGELRTLRRRPAHDARPLARLEPRVIARLNQCTEEWCEISIQSLTGWVQHDDVWGVYPYEVVE